MLTPCFLVRNLFFFVICFVLKFSFVFYYYLFNDFVTYFNVNFKALSFNIEVAKTLIFQQHGSIWWGRFIPSNKNIGKLWTIYSIFILLRVMSISLNRVSQFSLDLHVEKTFEGNFINLVKYTADNVQLILLMSDFSSPGQWWPYFFWSGKNEQTFKEPCKDASSKILFD